MEIQKTIDKSNRTETWIFERVKKKKKKKNDKLLARLTVRKRERSQIIKIRNEKEEISTDTAEIEKKKLTEYCEEL